MIIRHLIKRVLVPYNFNQASSAALEVAIQVCKRHNACLTIINVVPGPTLFTAARGIVADLVVTNRIEALNTRLRLVADEVVAKHGVEVSSIVRTGEVIDRVCDWALQWRSSLIVIGTRQSSGALGFLFQSFAEDMVRKASCPVLTVPASSKRLKFGKILFPVRQGIDPMDKYEQTRPFVRANNSSLIIDGFTSSYRYSAFSKLNDVIEGLIDEASNDSLSCSGFIRHTHDLASSVLLAAEIHESDLIVITATDDRSLRNLIYKSYTGQIINHSSVPVLCIQPAKLPSRLHHSATWT